MSLNILLPLKEIRTLNKNYQYRIAHLCQKYLYTLKPSKSLVAHQELSSFEGILEKDQEPMIMIPPEPLIEILSKRDSQNKLQEDHLIFHQMMMMMMEPVVVLMMEV